MSDRRPEDQKPRGSTLWVLGESIESADGSTRYAVKYEASPADLLAELRRQVESGTIKGEEVEAETLLQSGWFVQVGQSGLYLVMEVHHEQVDSG